MSDSLECIFKRARISLGNSKIREMAEGIGVAGPAYFLVLAILIPSAKIKI
jgi:hypothetical protein